MTGITLAAKRHWGYPERWMQLWLPQLAISAEYISGNETWAAQKADRFVAWYSLAETDGELWLDNLWVLPDFIGQGIGKTLFLHALGRSRLRNASVLKMVADPNAEVFYRRMGAIKIGEQRGEVDGALRILAGDGDKIMKNLGPKSSEWLASIGVHSLRDVARLGVVETYKRVKAAHPEKVSLNLLYGLQAALLEIPVNHLPKDIRDRLKQEAESL